MMTDGLASVGGVLGLLERIPALAQTPSAFAVVGMAAAFSAIVRAPLTGIVLIVEMTNNYEQLFPLLVACMIAFLVAERLHNKPIYEALLEYDLERKGLGQPLANAEPVTLVLAVERHSPLDGRLVRELDLPADSLLVLIVRGDREIFPTDDTRLLAGDHLTFFVKGDAPESCARLQAKAKGE